MREIRLTVYFEDPFWVGVFERMEKGQLSASKITFGAEPKDCEIQDFVLHGYERLKFSPAVTVQQKQNADNPKRRQRNAKKQLQGCGIGTKSQQALSALREEKKEERRKQSKEQREAEKRQRFEQKQQKRKEKHRGH